MVWLAIKFVDFLVNHWSRVEWLVPGAAMLAVYLTGGWTWLAGLHPVEIIAISLSVVAAMMIILTLLPQYLRQLLPLPFKVAAHTVTAWEDGNQGTLKVEVFIVNHSQRNHVILSFALCLISADGKEHWFRKPTMRDLTRELGPGKSAEGQVEFNVGPLSRIFGVGPQGLSLHVEDLISERNVRLPLPYSYPAHFMAN